MSHFWLWISVSFVCGFVFASILISRHARDVEHDRDRIARLLEELRRQHWKEKGEAVHAALLNDYES